MADEHRSAVRFDALLILMVAVYAAGPFLPAAVVGSGLPRIAIELILVGAVWRLRKGFTLPVLVTTVMVANEAAHAAAFRSPTPELAITRAVSMLAFLAVAIGFLAWFFWREEEVDASFLSGAVSVYLLLGFFWAGGFELLELVEPGSFRDICIARPGGVPDCDPVMGHYPRLQYLGFVTMTTLGYGDVVPLTFRAERLATLSAVTGQLFLAVLIGRIVANIRPSRNPGGAGR